MSDAKGGDRAGFAQDAITRFWQEAANEYNDRDVASHPSKNVALPGSPEYDAWSDSIAALLPPPPARVLDVGTGTGFVAGIAATLGYQVDGIDLAAAMIDASPEVGPGICFSLGDAVDPPFRDGLFDVVISRSLLWTLRDPAEAFSNWFRVLAPGGRLVCIYGIAPDDASGCSSGVSGHCSKLGFQGLQAHLPAIDLRDHGRVRTWAKNAGCVDIETVELHAVRGWETSPGSSQPFALVGSRALQ